MTHVALDRRFVAWQEEQDNTIQRLKDPRLYADDIGWMELQKHHRVVILAEAGSGKTEELRAQAQALASEGSFAFYTTVQSAAVEGFAESLPEPERSRLTSGSPRTNQRGFSSTALMRRSSAKFS